MVNRKQPVKRTYLFRASWRGTALSFRVEAKDESDAQVKAAREVKRMEGGSCCLSITLVKELYAAR